MAQQPYPQQQYPQQQPYPQQQQAYPQQQQGYPQQQGQPQQQQAYPQGQYPAGGQPQPGQPQAVVYQRPQHEKRIWDGYKSSQSLVLGWIQIGVAILAIVFNSIGINMQTKRTHYQQNAAFLISSGIWCPIFFLLAGGFALGAAKHKTTCMIVANMVLSIIATLFGFVFFGTASAAIGVERAGYQDYSSSFYWNNTAYPDNAVSRTSLAMACLLFILSAVEIVCSIWSSALCCAAVCCGTRGQAMTTAGTTTAMTTVHYANTTSPGVTQTVVVSGQPAGVASQGMYQPSYNPSYPQAGYQVQQPYPAPQQAAIGPVAPPSYDSTMGSTVEK